MIEITKVGPKKIQRKLLTKEQKNRICSKYACDNCPLAYRTLKGEVMCWERLEVHQRDIDRFWSEEVDV